ncbi:MAG: hypothetical protein KatS3mg115_2137 [Candidatus Poribacteria bacterium]|nr:MAG: hypothetical protein KatS3mg115_2137 [Candidatus Poribacteria bacterium]
MFRSELISGVQWQFVLAPIRAGRSQVSAQVQVGDQTLRETISLLVRGEGPVGERSAARVSIPEGPAPSEILSDLTGRRFVEATVEPERGLCPAAGDLSVSLLF